MIQPLYLAANPVEAEIVKDFLATHGIATRVRGGYAWGAVGELPFVEAYPRLYLEDERDRERALALIREYEQPVEKIHWRCPQCGEHSPGHFATCWNCGTEHAAPD
jgi:hypothetical protein